MEDVEPPDGSSLLPPATEKRLTSPASSHAREGSQYSSDIHVPSGHHDTSLGPATSPGLGTSSSNFPSRELGIKEADRLLETFKASMAPRFPFVVIPETTHAEQLRRERPFVFLTILAAASHRDFLMQRTLNREVRQVVSERMIIGGKMSFDLFQGLIVHLAW